MTVRWGFLGAGSIARSSVGPAVHRSANGVLHAVAAREPARAASLGPVRVHRDYASLLADPDIDAVYVALHNQAHREWVTAALEHGKPVLCEKPLGLSAAETSAMVTAAEKAGRALVEAFWNRWHPRTRRVEELLRVSAVGPVRQVTARFHGPQPGAGNYRRDAALGGGALLDVGCYAVAAVLAAVGWRLPTGVSARTQRWGDGGADRATGATLTFGDQVTAQLSAALDGTGDQELVVTGERGQIRLLENAFTAGTTACHAEIVVNGTRTVETFAPVDPYQLMVESFAAAAGDAAAPAWLPGPAESPAVAEVLDAIRASAVDARP